VHLNPDHFLDTPCGRPITPERNRWAWQQCFNALPSGLIAAAAARAPLYVLVGAQAAGKTTWARTVLEREPRAVVFDAILVKTSERAPVLAAARHHAVAAVAVWFRTPLAACLARNAARPPDELVDERALRNVFAAVEPPTEDEGFIRVVEVARDMVGSQLR
jgi:predicted kinase